MDVSLIDPALLAELSATRQPEEQEKHDSDLDAEGEDEEDVDAEGEEWDEPEVDQYLYVPQEETQVSQHLPVVNENYYDAPGPSSLTPLATNAPLFHFELPPVDAPGPKRRGRPPKSESRSRNGSTAPLSPSASTFISHNATPGPSRLNGSARPARTVATPLPKSKSTPALGSMAKGRKIATPAAPSSRARPIPPTPEKDRLCSFCCFDESQNKLGVREKMVGCHKCGRSGHPSCLEMNNKLAKAVMLYKWSCLECKVCEACNSKGDDSKLLFCDGCDRGYHYYCLDPPLDRPPKASFYCEPCKAERIRQRKLKALSSHATPNGTNGKGKSRADTLPHGDMDLSQHPVIKISSQPRRGRPPKHARYEDSSVFDDWDDGRFASATPQPSGVKKRKHRRDEMEDEDDEDDASYGASPAPRLTVRLTVGGRGRGRPRGRPPGAATGTGRGRGRGPGRGGMMGSSHAYLDAPMEGEEEQGMEVEEEEEEQIPYGGIITGADADTSKTTILESDKAAFAKSAQAAEKRLGGPRVDTWDPLGAQTPAVDKEAKSRKRKYDDEEYGASPGPGAAGTPAPKIARGRSLRDRLLDRSVGVSASTPDIGGLPGASDAFTNHSPLATPTRSSAANGSYFPLAGGDGSASPAPSLPGTPGPGTPGGDAGANGTPGAETGKSMKINQIRFGNMDIDTWYSAPYPEEYQYVPDGRLWLCEFCLRYMHSGFQAGRHRLKCKARHPPGDEIYREGEVSVFEVDGRKNKIYCQQLCLLAKMFLESKTLYYDVEPFLFYVMTQVDDLGARFVGYFSKEKRSPLNNVSCIMTLPVRQRKGWGQLLIDFSYALSKKEERVGSPEKPLSGLGEVTYKTYWKLTVFRYLRDSVGEVSMDDISKATSMTLSDIYNTLKDQDMIRLYTPSPPPVLLPIAYRNRIPGRGRGRGRGRGGAAAAARRAAAAAAESQSDESDENKVPEPGTYRITFDREYVLAVIKQDDVKGKLQLRPERLKYHPFLVTRAVKEAQEKEAAQLARKEQEEDENEADGDVVKDGKGVVRDANGVENESSDKTQVEAEERDVKAPNGTLDVIAGQGDAVILEQVEELAGPGHEHDARHAQSSTDKALEVDGDATPRKSSVNGNGPGHDVSTGTDAQMHGPDPTSLGKDEKTLQLVAALSSESPKRSLRKRDGSVSVTATPSRRDRTTRSLVLGEASPVQGK